MRAVVARLQPRISEAVRLRAAVVAALTVRSIPEAAGALLVAYGFGLAWRPLGFIMLGGFLLLAGRKLTP